MIRVYIALGSNLAQPLQQVNAALEALEHLPRTRLVTCSSFYRTKPLGPQNQPDFLNAVVALDTLLPPEQLLDHTQAIERNQGRVRKDERWGPRTLDIDRVQQAMPGRGITPKAVIEGPPRRRRARTPCWRA